VLVGRGVVVDRGDVDACAGGQQDAHTLGHRVRACAGGPATQPAARDEARSAEAGVAGAGLGIVERRRVARRIDVGEDVVDDPAVARG
jgi:hypothetical protein